MKSKMNGDRGRHRGAIHTGRGVRYYRRALSNALADPAVASACCWRGDLLPGLRDAPLTVPSFEAILANRHPKTGAFLRGFLSGAARQTKTGLLPDRLLGVDFLLKFDRSVSIAALVLGDQILRDEAMMALAFGAQELTRLADRRSRDRKSKHDVSPTSAALAVLIAEKADRKGRPDLHGHAVVPNVTNADQGFCAIHFARMMRGHSLVKLSVQRRLYWRLRSKGYAVQFALGCCRVLSVPDELMDIWSPSEDGPADLWPAREALGHDEVRRMSRRRDSFNMTQRPAKIFLPLDGWRERWMREAGPDMIKRGREQHFGSLSGTPTPTSRQKGPRRVDDCDENDAWSVLQPLETAVMLEEVPKAYRPMPDVAAILATAGRIGEAQVAGHLERHGPNVPLRLTVRVPMGAPPEMIERWVRLVALTMPLASLNVFQQSLDEPELRLEPFNPNAPDIQWAGILIWRLLHQLQPQSLGHIDRLLCERDGGVLEPHAPKISIVEEGLRP